jgi:AbrB family looped-hinge helix DNA binding protein
MAVAKVSHNFQVVIPKTIRERLRIKKGDLLQVDLDRERVILTRATVVPAGEEWYWSRAWQRKAKRAQVDLKRGKVSRYPSAAALRKALGD